MHHAVGRIASRFPVLYLAPIAVFVALGFFVRFIADDYCVAASAADQSPFGFMLSNYQSWLGRYTDSFLSALFTSARLPAIALIVPALLVFWLLGTYWAALEIVRVLGLSRPKSTAALLALVFVAAVLGGTPVPVQSVYWLDSMVSYGGSAYALSWLVGCMLFTARQGASGGGLAAMTVLTAIVAFLYGGLGEPTVLALLVVLTLCGGAALLWRVKDRPTWAALGAAWAGALLSLVVMLASPGNQARASQFEQTPIIDAVFDSLEHGAGLVVAQTLLFSPFAAITAGIGSGLVVWLAAEKPRRIPARVLRVIMLSTPVAAFAAMVVAVLPAFYALSLPPPGRLYIITQTIWLGGLAVVGACAALLLRQRTARPVDLSGRIGFTLAAMCAVSAIVLAINAARLVGPMATYAAEWEARDALIRQQQADGSRAVAIPPYTVDIAAATGLDTIGPDPGVWVNGCAAAYYQLDSLVTAPR